MYRMIQFITQFIRPIITEEMNKVESYLCMLLLKKFFILEMKDLFPEIEIKIISETGKIKISGYRESIQQVKLEIYQRKEQIKWYTIDLSPTMKTFYSECSEFIDELLYEKSGLKIVYKLNESQLIIRAFDENDLKKTKLKLENEIGELRVKDEFTDKANEDGLKEFIQENKSKIEGKYNPKRVVISFTNQPEPSLIVTGDLKILKEISKNIHDTLVTDLKIKTKLSIYSQEELKYFKLVTPKEFDNLQKDLFKKSKAMISIIEENDEFSMTFNGKRKTCKEAETRFQDLLKTRIEEKIILNELVNRRICETGEFNQKIQMIQKENKCVITTKFIQADSIGSNHELVVKTNKNEVSAEEACNKMNSSFLQ